MRATMGVGCRHGLKKATPYAKLKSFYAPHFFSIDKLHLFGHNLGHQVWKMLYGKLGKGSPLTLKRKYYTAVSEALAKARKHVPETFEGTFIYLQSQSGYARSVDWITFMRYIVPTLVIEQIDQQQQHARADKKADS
ncbi:hypothetical protein BDB00DRAFT_788343 [Zychaea mexicana]|uniref:uncharacterized protein n=1 Tax=Zychaea mexicana TaxID=64656 RepID=UPI0022FF2A3A|nr:uncharacterized protein BDB00DRAFT_788343 [Zychaea mexicana]KAI9492999.1 hypothetical protein BDB00DRAFT_788343 [Zychaea mexicana]